MSHLCPSRFARLEAQPPAEGAARAPLPALEEQLCLMTSQGWQGEGSPDRLDAMVLALTELTTGKTVIVVGWFNF